MTPADQNVLLSPFWYSKIFFGKSCNCPPETGHTVHIRTVALVWFIFKMLIISKLCLWHMFYAKREPGNAIW